MVSAVASVFCLPADAQAWTAGARTGGKGISMHTLCAAGVVACTALLACTLWGVTLPAFAVQV